jgi:hypothetical protein
VQVTMAYSQQFHTVLRPSWSNLSIPPPSVRSACSCRAAQLSLRLRAPAPVKSRAACDAGSEFCRSKGLTRATLRSPKRQLRAQPSGSEADFGPGGLATGLENYRPIILSTTQAAFVSILYFLYNLNLQPNQRILHHRILHIIETRRLKILAVT